MNKLYIIAGPNGAGKTTASYTILPEIFNCREFVNADEIAKGLSPLNPDSVGMQAGRIMLSRINELLNSKASFAFETTLATKSYVRLVERAQKLGYEVILLFLSLKSPELAIKRVETRVKEGGHNIPVEVIKRRFSNGLRNLFQLYIPTVNSWMLIDNSKPEFNVIATGDEKQISVEDESVWDQLKKEYEN